VTVYGGNVSVHTPPDKVGTVQTLETTKVGTGKVVEKPGKTAGSGVNVSATEVRVVATLVV
jgi:hypothetical protein